MKKLLLILAIIVLLACLALFPALSGGRVDYPRMLMVDDILYMDTRTAVPEPLESDFLGRTTSYTKKEPRKNGQTNIGKYEVPYAAAEGGLAVQVGESWYLFSPYSRTN